MENYTRKGWKNMEHNKREINKITKNARETEQER